MRQNRIGEAELLPGLILLGLILLGIPLLIVFLILHPLVPILWIFQLLERMGILVINT